MLVGSLISISVLVGLGFTATYSEEFVIIKQVDREVLRDNYEQRTGLWMLNFSAFTRTHTAALAIEGRTETDVTAF